MTDTKFTPGPWVYGVRRDGSIWVSLGDPMHGRHAQFDWYASEDDARMATAAPRMYERLERLLETVSCTCTFPSDDCCPVSAAHAVLAKAVQL